MTNTEAEFVMHNFNDILGNEINLDSFVVLSSASGGVIKLNVGRVIGFTPKKVKIYLLKYRGPFVKQEMDVFPIPENFVVINNQYNVRKLEREWDKIWSVKTV